LGFIIFCLEVGSFATIFMQSSDAHMMNISLHFV